MKNILIILIVFLSSCTAKEGPNLSPRVTEEPFKVIIIDECEYIYLREKSIGYAGYGYLAHKGNCKNSFHKTKK